MPGYPFYTCFSKMPLPKDPTPHLLGYRDVTWELEMNIMTACMCTVWTASTDAPIKATAMKNLEIKLRLSVLGSVLAIRVRPWAQCPKLPGKQRESRN